VRARPIRRLRRVEQKQAGESISIVYFLMAHAGRAAPLDKRKVRWLGFDEASEALDLGRSRRVLRKADRLVSAATGEEPPRYRVRRAAARVAEWLVLGSLALLYAAPVPLAAAPLALPAGMLAALAVRALLRPLEGRVPADRAAELPPGTEKLRLMVGGSEWMRRDDYLGAPIRIAAALAVLLPGLPATPRSWVAPIGLVLAALVSWAATRSGRRPPHAGMTLLRTPALWLALALAIHSIATARSVLALLAAFALSALSALAWWKLERRRAGVLAAVGLSRD